MNKRKEWQNIMNQSKEMARTACMALEDKKGEDIRVIDIHEISVVADYFIIANGNNPSQVEALVDSVEEKLEQAGHHVKRIEGSRSSSWVLMDYADIVVHIFDREDRLFYDLERIWSDGREIDYREL